MVSFKNSAFPESKEVGLQKVVNRLCRNKRIVHDGRNRDHVWMTEDEEKTHQSGQRAASHSDQQSVTVGPLLGRYQQVLCCLKCLKSTTYFWFAMVVVAVIPLDQQIQHKSLMGFVTIIWGTTHHQMEQNVWVHNLWMSSAEWSKINMMLSCTGWEQCHICKFVARISTNCISLSIAVQKLHHFLLAGSMCMLWCCLGVRPFWLELSCKLVSLFLEMLCKNIFLYTLPVTWKMCVQACCLSPSGT